MARREALKHKRRHQRGFSLVELLVSMAVVGVLAGISVPMTRELYRVVRITMLRVHYNILVQFGESIINDYEAGINPLGAEDGDFYWCSINGGGGGDPCSTYFDTAPVLKSRYRAGIQWVPYRGFSAVILMVSGTRVEMSMDIMDCKLGYNLTGVITWGAGKNIKLREVDYGRGFC